MHPIHGLEELGQSVWLATIFQKAISSSSAYDDLIGGAPANETDARIFERICVREVRSACDAFAGVYDESDGADGFVSIEVSPELAHDTTRSIEEAERLWATIERPNLMVKIPGTKEGVSAIFQCLSEGININVTLLFSVERYVTVAEAFLAALEERLSKELPIDRVASVASFFVSRVDAKVDKALDALKGAEHERGRVERGQAAVANAQLAFGEYERIISSDRWKRLAARGARPQRVLWASTSTKDPVYPALYYAEALIGRGTIDTMTKETVRAYMDHGKPKVRLATDGRAQDHLRNLSSVGLAFPRMMQELEDEGVAAFSTSFDRALESIATRRRMLQSA